MSASDPDAKRAEMREHWEHAASGWGKRAEDVRTMGMPVSIAMIEQAGLHAGQRVLELAAGPGDTGFLAAEIIAPGGGTLISSDGAEAMLDVARERARSLGIDNVEFKALELEWIDLDAASVDVILCRWGLMLSVDPEAAAREMRRVLRPGGKVAVAVWDDPGMNPWATIPSRILVGEGLVPPPDPDAPGMFSLAAPDALGQLLESAGFVDVVVESVPIERRYKDAEEYLAETLDLSQMFAGAIRGAPESQQESVRAQIAAALEPFRGADGMLLLPGRSLVAVANA